jgi:hypothetical protein
MTNEWLLYAGGLLIWLWGAGHLVPTQKIVAGFGELTEDNRRIVTMEWIAEGMTLGFLGLLAIVVTLLAQGNGALAVVVYRCIAVMLLAMAGLSLATGARTSILPMKLCPVVKTVAAVLLIAGSM